MIFEVHLFFYILVFISFIIKPLNDKLKHCLNTLKGTIQYLGFIFLKLLVVDLQLLCLLFELSHWHLGSLQVL